MRTRIVILMAAATLFGAATAAAQTPDSRWLAYIGCWRSIEVARETTICLVPGGQPSAIDLVAIDSGRVVTAEQIVATGQEIETAQGDCTGSESAQWSAVSDRVYLRSEETCPGWGTRVGTGLIALTREGHLLYIQGNRILTKTGVRVHRYREAADSIDLPSEVRDALSTVDGTLTATARARAAATAPLAIEDLAEASRALDVEVVEAWLIARGGTFNLDAKRLVALADAGVPTRITDLMIALSNPGVFVVDGSARRGARRAPIPLTDGSYAGSISVFPEFYRSCAALDYGFFGGYGLVPFASSYCDGSAYLYPYAYGWYPVSIVFTGSGSGGGGTSATSHGRVVNGRGYQEGQPSNPDVGRMGEGRTYAGGSTGSTPSTRTSSSGGEQRTAKPRP